MKLKGARLEGVLNLILKPVQLAFLPENDVLVITTAAKAAENRITRTYPVSDLYQGRSPLDAGGDRQKAVGAARGFFATSPADGAGEASGAVKDGDQATEPKLCNLRRAAGETRRFGRGDHQHN